MDFITALQFVVILNGASATVLVQCPPAEEGNDYSLMFKWASTSLDLNAYTTVYNNHSTVSVCTLTEMCINYLKGIYTTTYSMNQTISETALTVRMYNVSRKRHLGIDTTWHIKNKHFYNSCKVHTFSRIKSIVCNDQILDNNIHVTCYSSTVYPKAMCRIEMKSTASNTHFDNTVESQDPDYFRANCFVTIPIVNLRPGQNEILVIMYPNVTGKTTDEEFSTKHSHLIALDYPNATLIDCPPIVQEYTVVSCNCQKGHTRLIKIHLWWFKNMTGSSVENNPLSFTPSRAKEQKQVLSHFNLRKTGTTFAYAIQQGFSESLTASTFDENRRSKTFYCQVLNYYGWENVSLLYSPIVIAKFQGMTCNQNRLDDRFTLMCTIENVYPAALCLFQIVNKEVLRSHAMDNVHYITEKTSDDPTYFKIICTQYIIFSNLSHGQYSISDTMYPNVTGGDSDIIFGTNQSLFVTIDPFDHSISIWTVSTSITSIAGGNLIIFIICTIVWCLKSRGSSKILDTCTFCMAKDKTNYDDINDGYILAVYGVYPEDEQRNNHGYKTVGVSAPTTALPSEPDDNPDGYETIDDDFVVQINNYMNSGVESV